MSNPQPDPGPTEGTEKDQFEAGNYVALDLVVGGLVVILVVFLLVTMGIRSEDRSVHELCQDRLMALSSAQQSYLVANGKYTDDIRELADFLDKTDPRSGLKCPITGEPFRMAVHGTRFMIVAPYTGYSVNTGDASW